MLTEIALALVDAGRAKDEAIDEVERALTGILESLQSESDEFLKYPLGDDSEDLAAQAKPNFLLSEALSDGRTRDSG